MSILAPQAEEKGLALAALFAPDVPTAVIGDPVRLRQILVNLLSNAVKFTDRGHVSVEVLAEWGDVDSIRLAFRVRDTGIGIAAGTIERLFEAFTQADPSTTRRYGGTGLGLSICRHLAEQMGGGIAVASTVGVGSEFTCTAVVGLAGPARLDGDLGKPLAGTQILVVHERPVVAEAIERHLSTWAAAVVSAGSPAEALARAPEWAGAALALVGTARSAGLTQDVALLAAAHPARSLTIVAVAPLGARLPARDDVRAVISTPVRRAQLLDVTQRALGRLPLVEPSPATAPPALSLRILIAEDDLANQRAAILMLGRLGCAADVVGDGEQAVAAVLGGGYDLVLIDLQMPRADGMEAARRIRAHRPDRPYLVAMTASATDDVRRACAGAGMNAFLPKPVTLADLARVVAEATNRRAKHVEPATITIPDVEAGPAPAQIAVAAQAGEAAALGMPECPAGLAGRVLYVEDDPMLVRLVERIVAAMPGLTLCTAGQADAAVEIATADQPDLILLDLHLGGTTGEVVLRRLRDEPRTRTIPAAILSGAAAPEVVERLHDLGAVDFLRKPFTPGGLRALLTKHLSAR